MAVHCVFFAPGEELSCQVLRLTGASPRLRHTQRQLEARYCGSGRFISCPIFARVEEGLAEVDRARDAARAKQAAQPSADCSPSSVSLY